MLTDEDNQRKHEIKFDEGQEIELEDVTNAWVYPNSDYRHKW